MNVEISFPSEKVFQITAIILSFGLGVTSLEDLRNFSMFSKDGVLGWNVSKLQSPLFLTSRYAVLFDSLFNERGFKLLLYLKFFTSVLALFLAGFGVIHPLPILLLFGSNLLISVRSPFGLDGAHQMNLIILFALAIATLAGIPSKTSSICLWFLAGELILSYVIAGISKMISPIWRRTYALYAIFGTKTYGHELIFRIVSSNRFATRILCWAVLIFETFFPIAFLHSHLFITFFLIGVLFHLFNAVFMGLNTFFYAFLAAYPALLYCAIEAGLLGI